MVLKANLSAEEIVQQKKLMKSSLNDERVYGKDLGELAGHKKDELVSIKWLISELRRRYRGMTPKELVESRKTFLWKSESHTIRQLFDKVRAHLLILATSDYKLVKKNLNVIRHEYVLNRKQTIIKDESLLYALTKSMKTSVDLKKQEGHLLAEFKEIFEFWDDLFYARKTLFRTLKAKKSIYYTKKIIFPFEKLKVTELNQLSKLEYEMGDHKKIFKRETVESFDLKIA